METTKSASVPKGQKGIPKDVAAEKKDTPVDKTVPRTGGIVSETGEVLDSTGKAIGRIPESQNLQDLIGNTVNDAGDVVSKSGDVLGKTVPLEEEQEQSEYTTESPKDKKPGVLGLSGVKTTVDDTVKGVGSTVKAVGNMGGKGGGSDVPETDTQEEIPETESQEKVEGITLENRDEPSLEKSKGDVESKKDDVETSVPKDATSKPKSAPTVAPNKDSGLPKDQKDKVPAAYDLTKKAPAKPDESVQDEDTSTTSSFKDDTSKTDIDQDKMTETTKTAAPESEVSKTDASDLEGTEVPEPEAPEITPIDTDQAKIPETEQTKGLDTEEPKAPETEVPKSEVPEGEVPETELPKDKAPEGEVPESVAPGEEEPEIPKSEVPEGEVSAPELAGDEPEVPKDIQEGEFPKSEITPSEAPKSEAPGDELLEGEKKLEGEEELKPEGEEELKPEGVEELKPEGEEEEKPEEQEEPLDYSALKGCKVNKGGNLVNERGDVIGRVVEGELKHIIGRRSDENGDIWDNAGKKVGKAEPLPDSEREDLKEFAPFENFPGAVVDEQGRVMFEGKQVGVVIEGDPKRIKGSKVDEDGDILDRRGNVIGKAEAWDEPEVEPEPEIDMSSLAGKRVNKAGNVVSRDGEIYGRVVEGIVRNLVGRMCDKDGNIRSESGDIIGRAELVTEGEREGLKEGPFAELVGCTVAKDGTVVTPAGDVVGRLVSGDPKVLFGRAVDDDGEILDSNGNVIGKCERWEPPEEEKRTNPMAGRRVNREGNVLNEDGNIIGKLTSGDLLTCTGKQCDDDGDVVNAKGQTIGHCTLLEDIPPEPEKVEEETPEEKEKREQAAKDKKLAGQLAYCIEQSLDKIRPICKMITDKIDSAERKPKDELDEEELVKQVRPLIEEGGRVLTEANGVIRGLDPDGRIQRQAKQKAGSSEGTPEEHHLAEVLKELYGTVTETIDNARRKIADMPHAKKELNPLWGLLAEPLFQIIAAVGLLLSGVLGLVGKLLGGLGLGGLVDGLLGGLGLNRVLDGLGLGTIVGQLTGKKKK